MLHGLLQIIKVYIERIKKKKTQVVILCIPSFAVDIIRRARSVVNVLFSLWIIFSVFYSLGIEDPKHPPPPIL